jgi:hypothetical protein
MGWSMSFWAIDRLSRRRAGGLEPNWGYEIEGHPG